MPLDALADDFVHVCIDTSLNYYSGKCRAILEGQYVVNNALATPIVPDVPMQVTSTLYVDQMFGAGSVLAQALKTFFKIAPKNVDVTVIPRQDANSSVKALYTLTITGPATSDGTIDIFLGNKQYSISVPITSGASVATVAAAIVAAIPAEFPYTPAAISTGVTFTAKNGGTVGNFLNPVINWKGYQNYLPTGLTFSWARTTAGSVDPTPIDYAAALGTCCYNCYALLGGNATWQRALRDWIRASWACDKPQCFGHAYTYTMGTVGQVLARGDNSAEFNYLAIPAVSGVPTDVNFPWEMVADQMARRAATVVDNPELSIQGPDRGALGTIWRPATCTQPWTYPEQNQLRAAGFNVYGPVTGGQGVLTNPFIYNDVTNYLFDDENRPNVTFRDTNSRYITAKIVTEVATFLKDFEDLALFDRNTQIKTGVFGTNPRLIEAKFKAWAAEQVGIVWSQFTNPDTDIILKTDFDVAPKCQGVPGVMHLFFRYKPPVRLSRFNVTAQPDQIDNCVR